MAWTPQEQVWDPRHLAANLFAWFELRQAEALAWANDGGTPSLPPVADFFLNERVPTRFPSVMLRRAAYRTKTREDVAEVETVIQFEALLVHGDQQWLAANAPKYAMALESMVKNIPKTSLDENSKIEFTGSLLEIGTTFDFLRSSGNQFLQSFTVQVNWLCEFAN